MSWKSPYELTLPGITPDKLRAVVADHHNSYFTPTFNVSLHGDRIRACRSDGIVDNSENTAPHLKGTIAPDGDGVRISGRLSWGNLMVLPWTSLFTGLFLVALAVILPFLAPPGIWFAIPIGIVALLLSAVGVLGLVSGVGNDQGNRLGYVNDLNDAFHELVGLPPVDGLRFAHLGAPNTDHRGNPVKAWKGSVRAARHEDVPAVAVLAGQRAGNDDPARQERFSDLVNSGDALLCVAYADDGLAGYGVIQQLRPDSPQTPPGYYLTGLVVVPHQRRRGIGRALVTARLDWAWPRTDHVWYFQNSMNDVSQMTHRKLGFAEVARDITIPGVTFDWRDGTGVLYRADRPQS